MALVKLTPVEQRGDYWLKRDDLYEYAGVRGGKVRTCRVLCERAVDAGVAGVVTAGSRHSPQVEIVAAVAAHLGLRCRAHVPAGAPTEQLEYAAQLGAELVAHRPGYNSVIVARAREDALALGWHEVPFGMECSEAVQATSGQVFNLPECERVVVAIGSGMTAAGITVGMAAWWPELVPPMLGVVVGADPERRLDRWAWPFWRGLLELRLARESYGEHVAGELEGVLLDEVYEAKVLPFLEPGDLLWVVGRRLDGRNEREVEGRVRAARGVE